MIRKIKLSELDKGGFLHFEPSSRSKQYWSDLRDSLKNGYDPKSHRSGYITICKNGTIVDGNHRVTILKEMYDGDTEIMVKQLNHYNTWAKAFFMWTPLEDLSFMVKYTPEITHKEILLGDLQESSHLRNLNYIKRKSPSTIYYSKWDKLTKSLYEHGYDERDRRCIVIDQHNKIIDGYKRAHLLIRKYGNRLKIRVKVKQKLAKKRINIKMFILLFIITLTLILILN
jgi:hypothetical protein